MPTRKLVNALIVLLLGGLLASIPIWAHAQAAPQQPANEQVIVPQVDRRDVKLPRFPSKDFEFGVFAGTYSTENFGASGVAAKAGVARAAARRRVAKRMRLNVMEVPCKARGSMARRVGRVKRDAWWAWVFSRGCEFRRWRGRAA